MQEASELTLLCITGGVVSANSECPVKIEQRPSTPPSAAKQKLTKIMMLGIKFRIILHIIIPLLFLVCA